MDITTDLFFCARTDPDLLRIVLQRVSETDAKGVLIFACADENWTPALIDPVLNYFPEIAIFGAVFPYIVYRGTHHSAGFLVVGLSVLPHVTVIKNISAVNDTVKKQIGVLGKSVTQAKSLLLLIDGLTENIESFVEELCSFISKGVKVAGGGAGFLDPGKKPCVFTNAGMLQDAAVLVAFDTPVHLAAGHGWEIMTGPFLVTESRGNVLSSLNYAPACGFYQRQVEANTGVEHVDFAAMAKAFPLGLENLDGELLVREPIKTADGQLICMGEIHENSVLYLLKGDPDNLVAAAGETARAVTLMQTRTDHDSVILFDCISRALFLGDDYHKELDSIGDNLYRKDAFFGALTIGEICSNPNGQVLLLNKSTVLAAF